MARREGSTKTAALTTLALGPISDRGRNTLHLASPGPSQSKLAASRGVANATHGTARSPVLRILSDRAIRSGLVKLATGVPSYDALPGDALIHSPLTPAQRSVLND